MARKIFKFRVVSPPKKHVGGGHHQYDSWGSLIPTVVQFNLFNLATLTIQFCIEIPPKFGDFDREQWSP